jgi:hypothetical protein
MRCLPASEKDAAGRKGGKNSRLRLAGRTRRVAKTFASNENATRLSDGARRAAGDQPVASLLASAAISSIPTSMTYEAPVV